MEPEVVVALITSGAGFTVALASVPLNYVISHRMRREERQDVMARYRDPLLWSVHDLRSRIRTILYEGFLTRFLVEGDDPILNTGEAFMKPYALRHTMFVLAEYLGWVEILRRRVGFLDLGNRRLNRRLVELLSLIRRVLFAVDLGPMFHVPTGHQRAIGEFMITSDLDNAAQGWRCLGFAQFCSQLDSDRRFAAWFERLNRGIMQYAMQPDHDDDRLLELNLKLTELIDFLDPQLTRFPLRDEEKPRYRLPEMRIDSVASEGQLATSSHVVDQATADSRPEDVGLVSQSTRQDEEPPEGPD